MEEPIKIVIAIILLALLTFGLGFCAGILYCIDTKVHSITKKFPRESSK